MTITYNEFKNFIQKNLQNYIGNEINKLCIKHIPYVNCTKDIITLKSEPANSSYGLSLNDAYQVYCMESPDITMTDVMESITETLQELIQYGIPEEQRELERKLNDKNYIIANTTLMMINPKMNQELLQQIIYEPFLDLALICTVLIEIEDDISSVGVTKQMLNTCGLTKTELFEQARRNTERFMPAIITATPMQDVLHNETSHDDMLDELSRFLMTVKVPIYMITNELQLGASEVLANPDKLEEITNTVINNDFYIIPVDIDHLFVIPASESNAMICQQILNMIHHICKDTENMLSNTVYVYYHDLKQMGIVLFEKMTLQK